jgi:hypothetical protein
MRAAIAILALCAGCAAAARLGVSTSATTPTSPAAATPAAATPAAEVSSGPGGGPASSMLRPEQLKALIGLTLDQARARLHEIGHRGAVEILGSNDFGDCSYGRICGPCEYDHVCQVRPAGGTEVDDVVVLVVKAKAAIATPEP